jgi:PII-like signaling protein
MKWYTVSISDSVKAIDSQTAVNIFLEHLKNKTAQTMIETYDVNVEEDSDDLTEEN